MENNLQQPAASGHPTILLVGDDGRMTKLLRQATGANHLALAPSPFHALVRLDREPFSLVLLHAEPLAERLCPAVRALRQVCPDARILIYGEPHTEPHAQAALRAGAVDYLIWPVPSAQLQRLLAATFTSASPTPAPPDPPSGGPPAPSAPGTLLDLYRQLAELIPKGKETIIERARQTLPDLLGVAWIEIHPIGPDPVAQEAVVESSARGGLERPGRHIVLLNGPAGPTGRMILGPASGPPSAGPPRGGPQAAPAQIADFLAALLHLADRDGSLKHLATIDELTGAHNRRYLEYFLRQVLEASCERNTEVTLFVFDIDDFKHYNDAYGHFAGDHILRQAARLMRLCCRPHDVVARMGGDEFAVLFWDTGQPRPVHPGRQSTSAVSAPPGGPRGHPDLAVFLSNRFRRVMKTSEFTVLGPEARGKLAISGGLASFPRDGRSAVELLAHADQALLNAKRSGKDRIFLTGQP